MPRHTHPAPRATHSAAHIREARDRYCLRRFRAAKRRYGYLYRWGLNEYVHPETVRRAPAAYPFEWPFARPWNDWSRNPWTRCSCWMCSHDPDLEGRRSRERRAWRSDVHDQLAGDA